MEGVVDKPYSRTKSVITERPTNTFIIGYIISFLFVSVLSGFLTYIDFGSYTYAFLSRFLQMLVFLVLGIIQVLLYNKYISSKTGTKKISFPFMLSALVLVSLFLLDIIKERTNFFLSLASSCAFLLPSVIRHFWSLFSWVPEKENKVWYNFENIKDNRLTVYLNSIPLTIKLAKKYFDIEHELFPATLPGHLPFGKLFNKFLVNANEDSSIEIWDEKDEPFGWLFYVETMQGLVKKYIDPDLTLRENNVKDNSVIVAKRVKKEAEFKNEKFEVTA